MIFSDLRTVVNRVPRSTTFVRYALAAAITPGVTGPQTLYSAQLAESLLFEADQFFDVALFCFLIRNQFRASVASTWANIATYYSGYFCAASFTRIHLNSVTHVASGDAYQVKPISPLTLTFNISRRVGKFSHRESWGLYYSLVRAMTWPDEARTRLLAPVSGTDMFREQRFREKINYMPGEGFRELYMNMHSYRQEGLASHVVNMDATIGTLAEDAYGERLAAERLLHLAELFRALRDARSDPRAERDLYSSRKQIVARYGSTGPDRRFASALLK